MSSPSFIFVLAILLCDFSTFSLGQKLETTFPNGSPATDGSTELVSELRMQGALPTAGRLTQCTGFILTNPASNPFWVVQLTGHAPSTKVHHLALYGCTTRPSTPCACDLKQRTTIFVSVKNTPAIRFPTITDSYFGPPSQAGLQIGGSSTIQYILMEVHYSQALTEPDTTTGVDLQFTTTAVTIFIGILTIMGVGTIPAGQSGYNLDSCAKPTINNPTLPIAVIGYQVHTHSLGRVVSIYNNQIGSYSSDIGRGNPQFPQAYYPIRKGSYEDVYNTQTIILRCVFNTTSQTNPTYTIGVPNQVGTEMCFGNLLYATNVLPPVNPFLRGNCTQDNLAAFPPESTQLFPDIEKLNLHALYGNQTGIVSIEGTLSMNLDLETF